MKNTYRIFIQIKINDSSYQLFLIKDLILVNIITKADE